ncbi:histidine triad nucleotide-binding protein [Bifidobacterium sp. B4001]|uniref:histidine triad nucleotide-binding protein n=1 Tax=unclassified Bifidobacterium TaxID=2608897 RepID=UPI00226A5770|nr:MULTISPECIES: histidine triad nucleotide-binding protein [unclassified Bifidobacterium]MCX8643626.1 histidine triad nucleotide-binding protein [Bifidobacterium sp. B4077]MCX8645808.1 histidine triad nucleotide-binding protein [Bifidobacterium sp. B4081]MCX8647467.1 histidine triad nucleotide-binding protein [Bifidobacterium sp. B4107]MCX8651647.1 histidine triad nucleotide-binding protein [Bifidobacterium sp. B4111]MCX8658078.1 histidine triad nucleotide-binding protein [Bifidobacterium sp.
MSDDDRQEDCIFCRIVAGEVPSEKVYEDETVYAFKDANPKAAVHVLIVPRHHYASVADLAKADPDTLAHIVQVAQQIADQDYHGAYRLIFNTGEDAGQSVFHVHAHVLTGQVLPE